MSGTTDGHLHDHREELRRARARARRIVPASTTPRAPAACSWSTTDGYIDPAEEPFELLTLDQIGLHDVERMAASYDVMELSTAVKPWLLRHLLDPPRLRRGHLSRPRHPGLRLARGDRRTRPPARRRPHPALHRPLPRDGRKPSEEDILIAGAYNLGFISLGAGEQPTSSSNGGRSGSRTTASTNPSRALRRPALDRPGPGMWPGIDVLRDPGYNIAYWNLPARKLDDDGGRLPRRRQPLRFFHFSGFDPLRPSELSRHQNRIRQADPALPGSAPRTPGNCWVTASRRPQLALRLGHAGQRDRARPRSRAAYREGVESGR